MMTKITLLLFLLVCGACERGENSSPSESAAEALQEETTVREFMALVNGHRKKIGLRALIHIDEIALISQSHSQDMADKKVSFGHAGFSSRCLEAREVLGGGNLCAENVAMGQTTAKAVYLAWMNSATHRANIENPRLNRSGLGLAKASDGFTYWTHFFLEK